MLVRLKDIHTFGEFDVPFEARWATIANGEVRIVMHRSQLESLAEEIETVLADLPAEQEKDEGSLTGNTGAVATVLPAGRVEPRAAPDPIHEIYRGLTRRLWKGAA
jgi:hypothetical protein